MAFDFLRISIYDILFKMETLISYLGYTSTSGNMVIAFNLRNKISLKSQPCFICIRIVECAEVSNRLR